MRFLLAVRTFVANYFVTGWGFWIVGKPRLAFATVGAVAGLVLVFCGLRLILDPRGFIVYFALLAGLILGSCLWSAVLEYRRGKESAPPGNWRVSLLFAVVVIILFAPLRFFRADLLGYDSYRMPSSSMAPALVKGDYILADTWTYSRANIEIGDLAVFEVPELEGVLYVKRIVGVPGDVLSFSDGGLVRNGVLASEPYAVYLGDSRRPGNSFAEAHRSRRSIFCNG